MTWTKFLRPRFILLSSLFVVFCDRWKILEAVWYQKEDQTNLKEMDSQKLGPISSLKSIQNFDIYKEKRPYENLIKKEYGDGVLEIFKVMDWQHCASFCIRVCMKIHFEPILKKELIMKEVCFKTRMRNAWRLLHMPQRNFKRGH